MSRKKRGLVFRLDFSVMLWGGGGRGDILDFSVGVRRGGGKIQDFLGV